MPTAINRILQNPIIRAALVQAWRDSQPGVTGGHEEGGFILRDQAGSMRVARWPIGKQNSILMPPHLDCQMDGCEILATFHTHPNTGSDYLQEPSETDQRAVLDDPDLKGQAYAGELVISAEIIYLIASTGRVSEVGVTNEVLFEIEGG